ncbi:MAG: MaoC family dehydratase N-terminal domain-containing protein [Chloroflexi bacterium]|nr:MaoC family dehydratase N-terminal domain-containing protein [Chloroflexota bacterium]
MPLSTAVVGTSGEPVTHEMDARWMMAYAAGLGETLPCYLDTRRPQGIVAHPLFPVCLEWPALLAIRRRSGSKSLSPAEALRGVHATHDLTIYRGVRPGDRLTSQATIVGIERRKPGAYQVTRVETKDASGATVCTTWYGTLYRGVDVEGSNLPATNAPAAPGPVNPGTPVLSEVAIPVPELAAHIYTECSRIWNPIHTDSAVAARAGLPGLILHGTATLALAVSRVLHLEIGGGPERVCRVAGSFNAMVRMPSCISVHILSRHRSPEGNTVRFEVRNAEGGPAIRNGLMQFRALHMSSPGF